MGSAVYIWLIVVGTLVCGAANLLFTKYQDNQCVGHCDTDHPRLFEQPALQTLQMFIGEMLVFFVYWMVYTRKGSTEEHTKLLILDNVRLAVPAVCDLTGTTLLNVGLIYSPVSIYQMTRGSLVLFVALLLVVFLKKRVTKLEWILLFLITFGIGVVGYAGLSNGKGEGFSALVVVGIVLVVVAELVQLFQFVAEEHILGQHPIVPLQLVYCEGFYGFLILLVAMVILNFVFYFALPAEKYITSPFNIVQGVLEMVGNSRVMALLVLIMALIAAFNYCGISLTHEISATTRSTVDTCRTLLVWFCALAMGWEEFKVLQFVGFVILVFGTLCYNKVLKPEEWRWIPTALKDNVTLNYEPLNDREA